MKEKEWYTYRIFISSTFKDMDQERDTIKFQVISRLNEYYRNRKILFHAVDLRIGINTENLSEEQSENYVLDSCLQNIDKSRPFFIGLLGERYGWIPPAQRWEAVVNRLDKEKRRLLVNGKGKSVTELEILYGAIGEDGKYINHSLFFFRDEKSYFNVPKELISCYVDQNDECCDKNKKLKNRIIKIAECNRTKQICEKYHLTWDCDNGRFDGLDTFAELVFKKICHEIDEEIAERQPPQTWMEQELLNVDYLHKNNAFEIRLTQHDVILEYLASERQVVLTGPRGIGKSVLLTQIFDYFSKSDQWVCLSSFVGISPYSKTMHFIARRWIYELSGKEINENEEETVVMKILLSCIKEVDQKGKKVAIFIDGVENFIPVSSKDFFLAWLPDDIPFIATVSESLSEKLLLHHPNFTLAKIQSLEDLKKNEIINNLEEYFNCDLPDKLNSWICSNASCPICINLLMVIVAHFGVNDYQTIRNQDGCSEMNKINQYIDNILAPAPLHDIAKMLKFSVSKVADSLCCGVSLLRSVRYIAYSGGGLSEYDLEQLMGKDWDPLRFHSLMSIFNNHFYCEEDSNKWQFRNQKNAKAFFLNDVDEHKKIHREIAQLLLSYNDYEKQKQDLLFYHLLKAGCPDLARGIMTEIESEYRLDHGSWYNVSIYHILADEFLVSDVGNLCQGFSAQECVGFIHYLGRFVTLNRDYKVMSQIVDNNLDLVDFREINIKNAYRLSMLYCDMYITACTSRHYEDKICFNRRLYYLERSIEGFSYCYSICPDYEDSRNMLMYTLSSMLPELAEKKDIEKMNDYLFKINKLQKEL